jgi:cytochrome c peroxidase
VVWPLDNPYSPQKAKLGWLLFFDVRLSSDGTISCASCHSPDAAFVDGRAPTLEAQSLIALTNAREMGFDEAGIVRIVSGIESYRRLFREAFSMESISGLLVSGALATFERLVVSGDSPYDRFVAGNQAALTASQKLGMAFFTGVGRCATCHPPPLFTTGGFANIGTGMENKELDWGRFAITLRPRDRGAFRIPSLREVARTPPYMHDGSLRTLSEVLIIYHLGGMDNPWLDPRLAARGLPTIKDE